MKKETRIVDKSSIIVPDGTMEDFQRPDHPDFMTTSELKEKEFTGIRHNSLTNDCEIWLLGSIGECVTPQQVEMNLHAIDDAMARVFALEEVRPYHPALIAKRYKESKGE